MNTDFIPFDVRPDGSIPPRELRKLGGALSFTQSLRNGGAGSPRMIYEGGLAQFDHLNRRLEGELSFLSLEEVNDGLVFRFASGRKLSAVGLGYERLQALDLLSHRIYVIHRHRQSDKVGRLQKTIYHGEMAIKTVAGDIIRLTVPTRDYPSARKFLGRPCFSPYFRETVSTRTPELTYTGVLSRVGVEVDLL